MNNRDHSTSSIVVCGGGLAGLSAGVTALENGASVTLFEKAPNPGGSAALSGGALWGFSDFDRIRNLVPDGDAVLQWQVHEEINAARDWLEAQGAKLTPLQEYPHLGRIDRHMDPPQAIESLTKKFQQLGGQLFPEHAMESLMTSANGTVCGVRVVNNGHIKEIRAPAVILATGGFQGNAELLSRYIVRNPGNVTLRANPWSTGDGFLAATAIGGAASAGLHTFYGHCMVAPPSGTASVQ